ncbi:F-box protein At2g26160-like isoform X3 [Castanea sativa]|uniref:F-box protein At2g26160-like isoform X3 n=1 Tax=Castanea sativa TaxID=21020 RepID=UPI003F64BEE2
MRSASSLLDIFKICVCFQVALFITLIRGYVISSSSFRLTLFVTLLILTFLSPAHAEKDMSSFEFFLTILTSASSFVISESPLILVLILTDPSLISTIQPRLQRFLANRSSISSTSLVRPIFVLESNEPQAPSWSEIPTDMICEIGNRLPTFTDFKAISAVCSRWRSACLETTRWSLFPWLMLSDSIDTDLPCFFNLCDYRRYHFYGKRLLFRGKRCWGSQHGWVVTLGPDYVSQLVHLMKGKQINLPPLDKNRRLAGIDLEWFHLVHKFILFKDPSHELSNFLVIAIFGSMNRLAFSRVGEGAALNRRGQGEWAIVTNSNNLRFKDVARFKDQIYGLCDNGMLVHFELDAPLSAEVQVIASPPSKEDVGTPQKLYLMETLKNLYGVFRYEIYIPSKIRHETIYFLVYKFDFGAKAWEEVRGLEDQVFFVGDGNSWCIPTSTINSRSNCIYFTDDNWDSQRYPGVAYGGHDVGVFDMATGVIQPLPFGNDNRLFYSRPAKGLPASDVVRLV